MVARSFTEDYESPITLERLWKGGVLEGHLLMPKLIPQYIASVEVEGDGGVGSVTTFHFREAVEESKFVKDRVDELDHGNHVFKYTTIEGGLLGPKLTAYSHEIKLEAAAAGTKGKVTVNYETADDSPLPPEEVGKLTLGVVTMMKAVEAYLLANPDLYA